MTNLKESKETKKEKKKGRKKKGEEETVQVIQFRFLHVGSVFLQHSEHDHLIVVSV